MNKERKRGRVGDSLGRVWKKENQYKPNVLGRVGRVF